MDRRKFIAAKTEDLPMTIILSALMIIYSADITKAADFHGRVLGFQETYRFPRVGELST